MRKIALVNQKGGVGKTTTAVNLSAALSRLDRRVLLIDLDPQSNATISLGVDPRQQKYTSYSLLSGDPFQPLALSENFHLVPASIDLAGADLELAAEIGRETVLRANVEKVTGYDFLLIDCSPSLGLTSINALTTVDEIMIPFQCEFLALHGISLLMRTIELVNKRLNPGLHITGVIPCMYDARKGLARDVLVEIEKHFGSKVFKTRIRSNVRLAEAPSHGKSIFDYAPDSNGAEDYLALAKEIVGIEPIVREPSTGVDESEPAATVLEAPPPPAWAVDPAPPPPPVELQKPAASFAAEEPSNSGGVAIAEPPPTVAATTTEYPADPVVETPPLAPLIEPAPVLEAPPIMEAAPAMEPAPTPTAVETTSTIEASPPDPIVEFIELIPVEIEELTDASLPPPSQT